MLIREGLLQNTLAATKNEKSMLLIGPGTGISIMRSIIQHYSQTSWNTPTISDANNTTALPRIVLYVGCRKKTADFLFENEWLALQERLQSSATSHSSASSSLFTVIPAFSQDQLIKEYVTHKIKSNSALVWSMIQQVFHSFLFFFGIVIGGCRVVVLSYQVLQNACRKMSRKRSSQQS
jgi:sulfite reductase alpha subunit-like flavoprotein